jgi:hypothetical protein
MTKGEWGFHGDWFLVEGTADPSASLGMTKRRERLRGEDRCQWPRRTSGRRGVDKQPLLVENKKVTPSQDDGFVGGLKYNWLDMQKTRNARKSHRLSG